MGRALRLPLPTEVMETSSNMQSLGPTLTRRLVRTLVSCKASASSRPPPPRASTGRAMLVKLPLARPPPRSAMPHTLWSPVLWRKTPSLPPRSFGLMSLRPHGPQLSRNHSQRNQLPPRHQMPLELGTSPLELQPRLWLPSLFSERI